MELDLTHFKRRCVSITHQMADQPSILANSFRTLTIRNPCRLNNRFVCSHIVDYSNKAIVENLNRDSQTFVENTNRYSGDFLSLVSHFSYTIMSVSLGICL